MAELAIHCADGLSLEGLIKLAIRNADCEDYLTCDNKNESLESLLKRAFSVDELGNYALNVCGCSSGIAEEEDPIVGAVNGMVKADGAGNISAASDGTDYISSVVVDTTPQLGGNLDLNEKNIQLKEAPSANSTTSGNIISLTAGTALAFGDVCYMGSDGKMEKGDADSVATSFCFAMALAAINENASGLFALPGTIVRFDTWNWATIGQPVYLDTTTAGGLTQVAPSGTGDIVQIIGIATHANRILFLPQLVQVEIF